MKRQIKTFVAVATLVMTASSTLTADACDRGGRRVSVGRGRIGISVSPFRHYSTPVYSQSRTVYSQPQPVYSQPQPVYSQSGYSQPVHSQPVHTAPSSPAAGNRMISGGLSGTPVAAPATRRPSGSPSTGQVGQVNRAPANTPTQPKAEQNSTAEASALQMLASIGGQPSTTQDTGSQIPEFGAPASSQGGSHVGTWKVDLPGNQSVELVLKGDNSFAWTAAKDGKSNRFQGQYRLEGDRLTLVRSSDLQQMAGSWTVQGSGFTFKLDGATNAGLNFSRS